MYTPCSRTNRDNANTKQTYTHDGDTHVEVVCSYRRSRPTRLLKTLGGRLENVRDKDFPLIVLVQRKAERRAEISLRANIF